MDELDEIPTFEKTTEYETIDVLITGCYGHYLVRQ